MLLFGLLGVQIPPCPGTGQLCPSQAELCSPQLRVRAAGMVGGHMGRDPAPARTLSTALPAALPAWHPQLPSLGPTPGVSHGCCAAPAPCPARGPHPVPWGVSPRFTPPSSPLPEGVPGWAHPLSGGQRPQPVPGVCFPLPWGAWQGAVGLSPTTPWQGGSLAGGYRPALMAASPPIPVGSSPRNVWASLAWVRPGRGDVGALPPPQAQPSSCSFPLGPSLGLMGWGSLAITLPPPSPRFAINTFLEHRACE